MLFKNGRETEPEIGDRIALDMKSGEGSVTRNGFPLQIKLHGDQRPQYVRAFKEDGRNGAERAWWLLKLLDDSTRLKIRKLRSSDPNVECFELFDPSGGDAP